MKLLTFLLPVALLAFLAALFTKYARAEGADDLYPASVYTRADCLLSWALAAIYALVAFWGLGDTAAPQSYATLSPASAPAFVIPAESTVASLRYFAGIDPGNWTLEGSEDGSQYYSLDTVEMNYVAVLKWNDAPLTDYPGYHFTHFRLTSVSALELGELCLLDAAGERITPLAADVAGAALFDEQDTIPAEQTYLNSSYFDEIYHARTAWESLRGDGMYEITHPPLGKLIIALGLKLFGVTPFGWRFSGTLCGALMLPLLYAFVQRLYGRRSVSVGCTLIFAFDFMHFTQTRIATIDTYSVLFILGMYYYMFRFVHEEEHSRRTLFLSGLFFGLGAASKWTCLYAGAGLALIWLLYWIFNGELGKIAFWKNVLFCLGAFVLVPALIYYVSYFPYGESAGLRGVGMFCKGDYLRLVLDNQRYMFRYHSELVATHPYSSRWYEWLLDIRPILYYVHYSGESRSAIMAFSSPLLCWGGLGAMVCVGLRSWKDGRALYILLGYLAQLLPWVLVSRLTFAYHYFPSEVFLVLALGYVLSRLEESGKRGYTVAAAALAVGLFVLFYPCLSGRPCSVDYCENVLKWFGSWPV